MEVVPEEFGGTLVVLVEGDDLRKVPKSHRPLITPEIEAWWRDLSDAVCNIVEKAASPRMRDWFAAMADGGYWRLELHMADHGASRAGFWLSQPGIRGAEVGPPTDESLSDRLPPDLAAFYRLVGHVDWMGFMAAGGIDGVSWHTPLTEFGWKTYSGDAVDPTRTFAFGGGPGGDVLLYTGDGRAGWMCHENGKIHLLGGVIDTIDWVFGELLADRCPDFDYGWA